MGGALHIFSFSIALLGVFGGSSNLSSASKAARGLVLRGTVSVIPTPAQTVVTQGTGEGFDELLISASSHYDAGLQLGKLEVRMAEYLDLRQQQKDFQAILSYLETDAGSEAYESMLSAAQEKFPHLVEEIEGMAAGAVVEEKLLKVLSMEQELSILASEGKKKHQSLNAEGGIAICLNADGPARSISYNVDGGKLSAFAKLIRLEVHGDTSALQSYSYPGHLVGSDHFSWNDDGLAAAVNACNPSTINKLGVPKSFIIRAAVASPTIAEAQTTITDTEVASGICITLGQGNSDEVSMVNIEVANSVAADAVKGEKLDVQVTAARQGSFHVDTFKRLTVDQQGSALAQHRKARLLDLGAPQSTDECLVTMGDTGDKKYPLYGHGTPCTVLFDWFQGLTVLMKEKPGNTLQDRVNFPLKQALGIEVTGEWHPQWDETETPTAASSVIAWHEDGPYQSVE